MLTLWRNQQAYVDKYLSEAPGYFTTGDAGYFDERGYLHIDGRIDDVLNTAGHRISTGLLEQVVSGHPQVAECAVVAFNHSIKGECPFAFLVLKQGSTDLAKIEAEVMARVKQDIGAFAGLYGTILTPVLPKTRSGKIMRALIKKILNG